MKKSIYELVDVRVEEVSLVDKGANKRTFHIIKSLEGGNKDMDEFIKVYKALFGAEPVAPLVEVMKSLDEKDCKERIDAIAMIAKHEDDIPEEVLKALEVLVSTIPVMKIVDEKEEEVIEEEEIDSVQKEEVVEKKEVEKPDETELKKEEDSNLIEIDFLALKKEVEKEVISELQEKGVLVTS